MVTSRTRNPRGGDDEEGELEEGVGRGQEQRAAVAEGHQPADHGADLLPEHADRVAAHAVHQRHLRTGPLRCRPGDHARRHGQELPLAADLRLITVTTTTFASRASTASVGARFRLNRNI